MRKCIYLAALAAMTLVSCNEKTIDLPQSADGMAELEVSVPVAKTKVSGTPSGEDKVSNLQIFVFDKQSGALEAYGSADASTLKLTCLPGNKDIVALVNAPSQSGIATLSELQSKTSKLSENSTGKLVMSGQLTKELAASSNSVTINVSRLAAKVTLLSVKNQMTLEANRNKAFVVTAVYLINVAGDRTYLTSSAPGSWYNKMKYETGSPSFLYDSPKATLAYGKTYSTQHYFYCYPNPTSTDANGGTWSARKTRLVVEATLGGETCYYPVTLADVAQNTEYTVSLTVTRPGSSSPDIPVSTNEATFTVTVQDWKDGSDYVETI